MLLWISVWANISALFYSKGVKMVKSLVAGNWKMNGSRNFAETMVHNILRYGKDLLSQVDIAVFPPAVYLSVVADIVKDSSLGFGVQNIAATTEGAFTGEISAGMAQDFCCSYALVGHSERRIFFGETNEQTARKCELLSQLEMTSILCVGETLSERDQGLTEQVIQEQVVTVVNKLNEAQLKHLIVAYEPVWAIGTGKTASPEQAQSAHAHIREVVALNNPEVASELRILYGGSVKPENARTLFEQPDINGGLVGGASLEIDAFMTICEAAG